MLRLSLGLAVLIATSISGLMQEVTQWAYDEFDYLDLPEAWLPGIKLGLMYAVALPAAATAAWLAWRRYLSRIAGPIPGANWALAGVLVVFAWPALIVGLSKAGLAPGLVRFVFAYHLYGWPGPLLILAGLVLAFRAVPGQPSADGNVTG